MLGPFWAHANFKGKYLHDGLRQKKFEILYSWQKKFKIFFYRKLVSIKHHYLCKKVEKRQTNRQKWGYVLGPFWAHQYLIKTLLDPFLLGNVLVGPKRPTYPQWHAADRQRNKMAVFYC